MSESSIKCLSKFPWYNSIFLYNGFNHDTFPYIIFVFCFSLNYFLLDTVSNDKQWKTMYHPHHFCSCSKISLIPCYVSSPHIGNIKTRKSNSYLQGLDFLADDYTNYYNNTWWLMLRRAKARRAMKIHGVTSWCEGKPPGRGEAWVKSKGFAELPKQREGSNCERILLIRCFEWNMNKGGRRRVMAKDEDWDTGKDYGGLSVTIIHPEGEILRGSAAWLKVERDKMRW